MGRVWDGLAITASTCRGGFYVQYECQDKLGAGAFGEAVKARRRKVSQYLLGSLT